MGKTILFTSSNAAKESSFPFKTRLQDLLRNANEMKCLVGFFYFSGIKTLHEAINSNPDLKLKILVGLEAEEHMGQIVEFAGKSNPDTTTSIEDYMTSLKKVVAADCQDDKTFYERYSTFVQLLKENRLEIRKTREPNHAKMYLFSLKKDQLYPNVWLMGSSNLTWKALEGQQELNVDLAQLYQEDANAYFDELWNDSIELTDEENKKKIIHVIENESVVAPVTPFEAYAKVLKTIAEKESVVDASLEKRIAKILDKAGFDNFKYQSDATLSALNIIEEYRGVIIADVVGLGKSIIASLIGNLLSGNGLVIAPPGLVGKNGKSGWSMYLNKFGLKDRGWDAKSLGIFESNDFESFRDEVMLRNYDTIVIDEAHRFRNQDTDAYSKLWQICNGRKVILLTATPFNNSPADFASLLKLFLDMGNSKLCAGGDLQETFRKLTVRFDAANYLLSHLTNRIMSQNEWKKQWKTLFNEDYKKGFNLTDSDCARIRRKIKDEMQKISDEVREIIAPVTIRRNRLDIKNNPEYAKDVKDMPKVVPPKEQFYQLSREQSVFYDKVANEYLSDKNFTGAVYRPYAYKRASEEDSSENVQQEGMYKFMRRLLVRRFESSFGAFAKTVENAIRYYRIVDKIAKEKGFVFQSRKLLEKFSDLCSDDADEEEFNDFWKLVENEERKRTSRDKEILYWVNDKDFDKKLFFEDLQKDISTFNSILNDIERLKLLEKDPKAIQLVQIIKDVLDCKHKDIDKAKNRKVIVFSEFTDTIKHLKGFFEKSSLKKVFLAPESVNDDVLENFDASHSKTDDKYKILLVSDRFSEGLNLSKAGLVINYDIPWNPTRVIQRIGRINRIGNKVFDNLYIFNYFPSDVGADIIHSKEIAANKMAMIYKILGEDSRVLTENDDNPSPSKLFDKLNENPENDEVMSPITEIRIKWKKIQEEHPDIAERVNNLPNRVKSAAAAKKEDDVGIYVMKKKNGILWCVWENANGERALIHAVDFAHRIECKINEKSLPIAENDFWKKYKELSTLSPKDLESKGSLNKVSPNDTSVGALKVVAEARNYAIPNSDIDEFLKLLQDDIVNWRTIPKYDLKIISRQVPKDIDALYEKLKYLKELLQVTKKVRGQQRENSRKPDEIVIGVNLI